MSVNFEAIPSWKNLIGENLLCKGRTFKVAEVN